MTCREAINQSERAFAEFLRELRGAHRNGDLAYERIDARDGYQKARLLVETLERKARDSGDPRWQEAFDKYRRSACNGEALPP